MIKQLMTILFIVTVIFSLCSFASADKVLDEIQNYDVKVEMRSDGTMDINYHIEWKVLDDTSEGPLSWVKIGIPNSHVDEITAGTDNIKEIRYYSDGGSFVRIDFDREYYKDEVISFNFSIHQSYMYIIEKDEHICRYSFTPGWFDNIEVKNITIKWNEANVLESTAQLKEDNYLIWTASLGLGERLNASVKYNLDVFTTNEEEQYVEGDAGSSGGEIVLIIFVITIAVMFIFFLIAYVSDDYGSHGGFGGGSGYRSTYIHHHSSCARSSCACVSSCACACACAGGGRAGCSKKDFYGTNLKTKKIKEAISKIAKEDNSN